MDNKLKQQSSWARGTVIGKGSYGTVSLAVKNKSAGINNGAVFAVKSVDTSSCLPSQIEALENEIRILSSLSSPYVVEYLGDDATLEATTFRNLHMEYLPGGTVADLARTRRYPSCFGVEEDKIIRNYAFCLVSGLKYLHSQGIVHCDIKSDNVLVGPTIGTAKLADFGSSAAASDLLRARGDSKIMPRGSPLWMAPEVIRGEYQGPESDVWSLGCTVIEMVTGKPPWEGKGAVAETICRIGYSDELPRMPTQLSETGRDFVEKCLRREVSQRWSCDQLLQHPFISKCTPPEFANYSSPRCVLDWFSLDSDEEDEGGENTNASTTTTSYINSQAKDRIAKLDSGRRAVWESDGWTVVRGLFTETESESVEEEVSISVSDADADADEQEAEGTRRWAYWELNGIEGAELEDGDSIGIGEWSTNVECLLDSDNCSAVVEQVRSGHNHQDDGVINVATVDRFESQTGLSHSQCTTTYYSLLLLLLVSYWFLIFHQTICTQLLVVDLMAYMKAFYCIFNCSPVCSGQQFYFCDGNFPQVWRALRCYFFFRSCS